MTLKEIRQRLKTRGFVKLLVTPAQWESIDNAGFEVTMSPRSTYWRSDPSRRWITVRRRPR